MIKEQFSKAAKTYNQYAITQKKIAEFLLTQVKQFISPSLPDLKPSFDSIDLGCGTGYVTQKLHKLIKEIAKQRDIQTIGIDFSEGMISKAILDSISCTDDKFNPNQSIGYEQRSIEEELNEETQYDLIFSNASLHWLSDINSFFHKLKHKIVQTQNYSGKAFFNLYVEGSLDNLNTLFIDNKNTIKIENKTTQTENFNLTIPYPTIQQVKECLKRESYRVLFFTEKTYKVTYSSFKEFHFQQNQLGTFKPPSGSIMSSYRLLKNNYHIVSQNTPFVCTYKILFLGIENEKCTNQNKK